MATQWGGWSEPPREEGLDRRGALTELIEGEIIPRLLAAHGLARAAAAPAPVVGVDEADVDALLPLALGAGAPEVLACVRGVMARGVPLAAAFTDLIAPVARRLGEWWEQDRVDFVDVTMALWRLQETVRTIAAGEADVRPCARRAVIAPCPGDQHSLGTAMVDELFRRAGWDTARPEEDDGDALVAFVEAQRYDLVGLTVSCDARLAELPALVARLRAASRNPALVVMLGGRAINADPALARRLGADATAADGPSAVARAEALLGAMEAAPAGRA